MVVAYPAVFHFDEDGMWAEFPDLEGCQTDADNLSDLIQNASEALGLYLCMARETGEKIAPPSDLRKIKVNENEMVNAVAADPDLYEKRNKAIKKTLSLPMWLNERAERANINFSATLQEALKTKLNIL